MMTIATNTMPDDTTETLATAGISQGEVSDYFALLKPRVMFLVVFTALVGMVVVPSGRTPGRRLRVAPDDRRRRRRLRLPQHVVGCGYRRHHGPARASARSRPGEIAPGRGARLRHDPRGRLGHRARVSSATVLAASLLAFTIFFYVVIYSMWLKRSTPQNIVIGGAAGALPPIVAQAAVDRPRRARRASCSSPSSSSGRRRISGRWRW